MRFAAVVDIELPADVVERSPTFWEQCSGLVGAKVDLATERVRSRIEAATFLYEVRSALEALGIDNARSLLVDGTLVFEDDKGHPDNLPELITAFADHLLLQTAPIRQLRLSVEHEEAGLFLELEARMAVEHPREEPAARVSIVGRVFDLAPREGESGEAFRARMEQLIADVNHWVVLKLQFDTFVSRVEQALGASLPGASLKTKVGQFRLDLGDELAPSFPPAKQRPPSLGTAAPPRNFTLSLEQRISAAMAGPPRYAVRLRRLEDLESELVNQLALSERESLDVVPAKVERGLGELNRLIDAHNRYYPIERNLPMDPATGALVVVDEPWKPLPHVSIARLRALTAQMRRGRHPLG